MKSCKNCIACEAIEYVNPYYVVYECRQADIALNDLQLAEGCSCYERDMSLGGVWDIKEFWKLHKGVK